MQPLLPADTPALDPSPTSTNTKPSGKLDTLTKLSVALDAQQEASDILTELNSNSLDQSPRENPKTSEATSTLPNASTDDIMHTSATESTSVQQAVDRAVTMVKAAEAAEKVKKQVKEVVKAAVHEEVAKVTRENERKKRKAKAQAKDQEKNDEDNENDKKKDKETAKSKGKHDDQDSTDTTSAEKLDGAAAAAAATATATTAAAAAAAAAAAIVSARAPAAPLPQPTTPGLPAVASDTSPTEVVEHRDHDGTLLQHNTAVRHYAGGYQVFPSRNPEFSDKQIDQKGKGEVLLHVERCVLSSTLSPPCVDRSKMPSTTQRLNPLPQVNQLPKHLLLALLLRLPRPHPILPPLPPPTGV